MLPLGGDRQLDEPQPTNGVPGVGIFTPCRAVSTRGITVFVPALSELYKYGSVSDPGMGPYRARVALAPRTLANQRSAKGLGIHTVRGCINPGDHRLRPRFVGVVDV